MVLRLACGSGQGSGGTGNCSSKSTRTGRQSLVGCLKRRYSLLTRDARKFVEKFIQSVAIFEAIDQIAQGHPGSHKHRRTAENLGATMDYWFLSAHR
jgi:hypothetical protein